MKYRLCLAFAVLLVATVCASFVSSARADDLTRYQLSDGATYLIEVPAQWNGTLFLYSHGIQGAPNPAKVAQDSFSRNWLLAHGYALAGGSYACVDCYDPRSSYPSQIRVLDKFNELVGHPSRTIAWGHSIGGAITADLLNYYPDRFVGGLILCGYRIQGSVGNFNERLDHEFVLTTLLGFNQPLVDIGLGHGQVTAFRNAETQVIDTAQQTVQGRARLALAEAMVNTPDWANDPFMPEPAPTDYAAREYNQYLTARADIYYDAERAFDEALVGVWNSSTDGSVSDGNFSWNAGVDYSVQLRRSADSGLVTALYQEAGLSLADDLARLSVAPRIAADPGAVSKLEQIEPVFGRIGSANVVTLNTEGDTTVYANTASGYADAVDAAGAADQLRSLFVRRAGHCEFTGAEELAAIQTLLLRLDQGTWPATDAASLNARAIALGSAYNKFVGISNTDGKPQAPMFDNYAAPLFLRNFNTFSINPYP